MSKFLVVHPGASWATHDVYVGVVEGLRARGCAVAEFRLDGRLERSRDFLHFLWRRQKRAAAERKWPKPTLGDVLFMASQGIIERALERGCTDVLFISASFLPAERLELARRAGLRVWMLCTETPYEMARELELASMADGVWTHERAALPAFRAVNPRAEYLPHAWRSGVHDAPAAPESPECDVLFCGSMFPERAAWFESINWDGINLALYGNFDGLAPRSPLRKFIRGGLVPNGALVSLARRSRIVLNFFRAPESGVPAESLNPRCYEMAAARVCLVTDRRSEVLEKFGEAVPTFSTPAEAETLIRALLADDERRTACAASAARAVAADTWGARVEQMLANVAAWRSSASASLKKGA